MTDDREAPRALSDQEREALHRVIGRIRPDARRKAEDVWAAARDYDLAEDERAEEAERYAETLAAAIDTFFYDLRYTAPECVNASPSSGTASPRSWRPWAIPRRAKQRGGRRDPPGVDS